MDAYIQALIELHLGVGREGPGDLVFAQQVLDDLPTLPPEPGIIDLGCGSGAATLLLAEHYGVPVKAVDLAQPFLDAMMEKARARGLADRIEPLACDFSELAVEPESIDLLWSEGAAYNLTFAGALEKWRPLLTSNGVAVISELTWFTDEVPEATRRYWQEAYPAIGSEIDNIARAKAAAFNVVNTRRLPDQAWWDNYYNPILERIDAISKPDANMQAVVEEMQTEIDLFRQYSKHYGYTFYVLTVA